MTKKMPIINYLIKNKAFYQRLIIILSCVLFLNGCKDVLYSDIPERDINIMIMLLEKNGVSARREKNDNNSYSILIDGENFSQAVNILAANGYPKKKFQTFGDIFNDDGIVKTPFEQRARFMHALNQELSQSLSEIEGVITARVHVTLPEKSRFGTKDSKPSAAVMILHNPEKNLQNLMPKIKQFVAYSISDVTYEDVSVVLMPAGQSAGSGKQKPTIEAESSTIAGRTNFDSPSMKSGQIQYQLPQNKNAAVIPYANINTHFAKTEDNWLASTIQMIAVVSIVIASLCILMALFLRFNKSRKEG